MYDKLLLQHQPQKKIVALINMYNELFFFNKKMYDGL